MSRFEYNYRKVFFKITGRGQPLLLLHDNAASARMFGRLTRLLAKEFSIILVDYPGHGRSDRIPDFPLDYWYANALMVINLIDHLDLRQINVLGSSGGALVAINMALERPDLVGRLIADSFTGTHSLARHVEPLAAAREIAKKNHAARLFWLWNHGRDWRQIVDQDTRMRLRFHAQIGNFFHHDIAELSAPVLLTGSEQDEFLPDIHPLYAELAQRIGTTADVHIFEKGVHPAALNNSRAFAQLAGTFFNRPNCSRPIAG